MELQEVMSSNIKKVGYDGQDLLVEYLSGAQYKYKGVPEEVFNNLMQAESKGKFVNSEIKAKYLFEKVEK